MLFDELSFSVDSGHILEIAGANGSGKTSLMRILCGLREADSGAVSWMGKDIHEHDHHYRNDLAYIGYESGIKPDLTTLENLNFSASLLSEKCPLTAEQALAEVGLDKYAWTLCSRLSTGQKRRIALARLLLTNARVWVLDEPLTGLDKAVKQLIGNMLVRHAAQGGVVILTTHEPIELTNASVQQLWLGQ